MKEYTWTVEYTESFDIEAIAENVLNGQNIEEAISSYDDIIYYGFIGEIKKDVRKLIDKKRK